MKRLTLPLLVLTSILTAPLLAQVHPNLERGQKAGKAYHIGDVDSVNLFNGNLSIAIPLGQTYSAGGGLPYSFVLRYNSNAWDHNLVTFENDCTWPYKSITVTQTTPHQVSSGLNAGLGWSLDFGTLLAAGFGEYSDEWTYVSPDGSKHLFFMNMHEEETERPGYRYTRDSSYMRLVASDFSNGGACPSGWLAAMIEFADGRQQVFTRTDTCNPFVLTSERDRFGNLLTFTFNASFNRWEIADSQGRTHKIWLRSQPGFDYQVIDRVELAAFDDPDLAGAQTAVYTFVYATATIARSCKHYYDPWWDDCNPQLPEEMTMSFLTRIIQPDGSEWSMLNGTTPAYNLDSRTLCNTGSIPKDRPGTITHLKNPVGGTYDWTYDTWSNPEGVSLCYSSPHQIATVKDATGVYDRTLTDPFGAASPGLWKYRHDSWRINGAVDSTSQESWTIVTSPESDESKHYFRTHYCGAANEGWDYGLPFTKGRYGEKVGAPISTEQYDGSAADPANLRRLTYLRYGSDTRQWFYGPTWLQNLNRRVELEATTFIDDASRYTTVEYSDFDGLGHFRAATTGGDFGAGNVRQATTAYNPGLSYPAASAPADWWPYTSPWIINTYTSATVSEGGSTAKSEACFDPATGYLLQTRALMATGTSADPAQSSADVVLRRTQTAGNTTREEWFGGDNQAIGTGSLCGLSLKNPAYRIDHTYLYGSLRTSRYVSSAGTPLSYFLVDQDLDASTGLVSTSRDSAGLATDFNYDTMGRLTWEKPRASPVNGGAWVQHCYSAAGPPATPAGVASYWSANGTSTGCNWPTAIKIDLLQVNGFGNTWREYRRFTDANWAQRLTTYTGSGWMSSLSEWQPHTPPVVKKTEYLGFDPFGRPATIRPPDGPSHDTTLSYIGIRSTSRSVKVATAPGVETTSTTTEERDRQGRLWKVTEPSADSGANVTTTYSYDVGGRLKQASTSSGLTTQNRFFTYDNRGFLRSEQLPEVGAYGNGRVTYSEYDARGHARRVQDGTHDLSYTYDAAERLTKVAQADASGNPTTAVVKALAYASANGASNWKNGKLETATAYNLDLSKAEVVETYAYGGVGGRPSSRQTEVEGRAINQAFTWNELGQLASLGYPDDTVLGASVDPPRSITHTYAHGFLTAIPLYLTSISYHPNGMVNEVLRSNGMKDVHTRDANDMPRPGAITVQRALDGVVYGGWGPYEWDGAGNMKVAGSDSFTYDLVSRLKSGTTTYGSNRQCATYNAFGTLNGLGTGTTTCTASPISISDSTNRLGSPVLYDAAGNMRTWGGNTYTFSRENQMVTITGTGINRNYGYTAAGERIFDRNNLDNTGTLSIRDLSGKVLREYGRTGAGTWSWSKDYVYREGQLAATVTPAETRHFHLDHLGSARGATNTQNPPAIMWETVRDYYPFGLEASAAADLERMRFTGHQRDTQGTLSQTDDLDYMHARHYNPVVGRFLSVDPGRDWNAREPQSWNLYAYARNNPVNFIDPFGLMAECVGDRCTDSATVIAADPGAESARRFELELRMMRMRRERDQASSRQRQILGDVYRMSNRPVNYIAGATFAVNGGMGALAVGVPGGITTLGLRLAPAVGAGWQTSLYYYNELAESGRMFLFQTLPMNFLTSAPSVPWGPSGFVGVQFYLNNKVWALVYNPTTFEVWHLSGGPLK